MGEILKHEFSRKTFVKGSGAVVIGLGVGGALSAPAGAAVKAPNVAPDQTLIDTWLQINPDNSVSLFTNKLEVGQGTWTGHRMILAEELDVDVSSVTIPFWDSAGPNPFPDGGPTVGSSGTSVGGPPLRQAAAEARQVLLGMASTQLGVPVSQLTVSNGVVSGGGKTVKYSDLLGGKQFNAKITGTAPVKPTSQYKVIGTRVPRFDIPDKVTGKYTYIQNVRVPGMLHGRPVRPRGQANVFGLSPEGGPASFTVLGIDESTVKHIPGVQVVRKGNFVGVVAPTEYAAIQAAAALKVSWSQPDTLPGVGNQYGATRSAPSRDARILDYGNVDTALKSADKVLTATYQFPIHMHAPIGPVCSIADVRADGATMWMSGQDTWGYKAGIVKATGIPLEKIRLIHFESASTNNREPHTHPAVDAAIMSQIVGKPVRVQLMRWDSHGYEAYGHINVMDIRGGLDAAGKLIAYDVVSWLPPNTTAVSDGTNAPGNVQIGNLVPPDATSGSSVRGAPSSGAPTTPNPASGGARFETFSSGDQYFPNIAHRRFTGKTVPNIFRTCPLRGPDCIQTAWASEQMIDELAHAANMDPVAFRRNMTTHDGWLAAMDAVVEASNWQPKVAASKLSDANVVTGRGFAFAGENHAHSDAYAAVVADVEVNKETGKITVKHLYGSQDSGVIVNPALVENQMVGMLTQGASRALHEEVTFSKKAVTSLDWVSYPMLRFKDAPTVTTIVIGRPNEVVAPSASPSNLAGARYRGGGESLTVPVPAAIANAVFDAIGVRMRQAPLTPAKVRAALRANGGK